MEDITKEKLYEFWPAIFVLLVIVFIVFLSIYNFFIPRTILPPGVNFEVKRGLTLREISEGLEKQGIINSAFSLRLFLLAQQGKVQAGVYHFEGGLNTRDVAQILIHGGKELALTFFEGMNLSQIQDALKVAGVEVDFSKQNLKNYGQQFSFLRNFNNATSLEGFLFPDTYFFFKDVTTTDAISKFLINFQRKALPLFLQSQSKDYYSDLILASLLEEEIQKKEDKTLVADILKRRLKIGMKLDVDATVVYVTKNPNVSKIDLQINSPYNTYRYRGLPPTPISNPGIDSIEAALSPKANDFWYYLTDRQGGVYYAKTIEEQLENKAKYLGK